MDENNLNAPNDQRPMQPEPPKPPLPLAQAPVDIQATDAEKNALFSVAGSVMMMVYAIVISVSTYFSLMGDIVSLNILGIFGVVFNVLTVIGVWVLFATAKKKKLSTAGITLIKVPFVINFVFGIIGGVFGLILNIVTFNFGGLFINLLKFVFNIIYFASISKLLKIGMSIEKDQSVFGMKAGMFAAVATIIFAVINLIGAIIDKIAGSVILNFIMEQIGSVSGLDEITMAGSGVIAIGWVAMIIEFLVSIYAAVMIILFNKKLG